jgi:hypothetical protein
MGSTTARYKGGDEFFSKKFSVAGIARARRKPLICLRTYYALLNPQADLFNGVKSCCAEKNFQ